jgi:hypothetical protein
MVASTATLAALRAAIRQRQAVAFQAKGQPREFSPHVLGTKDGQWRVFGWQSGGGSGGTLKAGGDWRCFGVADVAGIAVLPGAWQSGDPTGAFGLTCIDLIDTAADLDYAAKALQGRKKRPHER